MRYLLVIYQLNWQLCSLEDQLNFENILICYNSHGRIGTFITGVVIIYSSLKCTDLVYITKLRIRNPKVKAQCLMRPLEVYTKGYMSCSRSLSGNSNRIMSSYASVTHIPFTTFLSLTLYSQFSLSIVRLLRDPPHH